MFDSIVLNMVKGILGRSRRYVAVEAVTDARGETLPRAVIWRDGRRFEVDGVLDARRASSLKVGGSGVRYTVRIGDSVTYLFLEGPRWFVEEKCYGELAGR